MTLQNFTLGTFAQGAAGGGGAFESIATFTASGSTATCTFSSIPSTYQHIQIRAQIRMDNNSGTTYNPELRFNSDSGSNYAYHELRGNGSTTDINKGTSQTYVILYSAAPTGTPNSSFSGLIVDVLDYASTSKNKTVRYIAGTDQNGQGRISLGSGLWMSTSAVNTITITSAGGNYETGTTIALYGIKGA